MNETLLFCLEKPCTNKDDKNSLAEIVIAVFRAVCLELKHILFSLSNKIFAC